MKAIVQKDPDNYGQDELWLLPSRNYTDPCFTAFFFFFFLPVVSVDFFFFNFDTETKIPRENQIEGSGVVRGDRERQRQDLGRVPQREGNNGLFGPRWMSPLTRLWILVEKSSKDF